MSLLLFVAMKPHEIQEKLGLTRIRDRNWYVQPSCATTGDGLYEGLTWLTSNIKSWSARMHRQYVCLPRQFDDVCTGVCTRLVTIKYLTVCSYLIMLQGSCLIC